MHFSASRNWLALAVLLAGCSTTRQITLSARPDDATFIIDGENVGRGPIEHKFVFRSDHDEHDVTASRIGFKDQTIQLTRSYDAGNLLIELRPQTRRVTFDVMPVPARLKIDGKPLSDEPVSHISEELEFTADAQGHWTTHTITAERANWLPAGQQINWD